MQLSCIGALLFLIGLFNWWPLRGLAADERIYNTAGQEVIAMEQVLPTQQSARRPPPPAPLIPVVVPDDVVLDDEVEFEDTNLELEADGDDEDAPEAPPA